jgi:hypothetical protein
MPQPAQSQLTPVDPRCDYTVWFFSSLDIFHPDATDCAGAFAGSDVSQQAAVGAEIVGQGWGTSATYVGTTSANTTSGPFSYVPDEIVGFLSFDSPLSGDYVIALRASQQFSLYYFAGLAAQSAIFYTTLGTAQDGPGIPKDLVSASLWSVGRGVSVPEPASAALMLTGIVALGFVAGRRRNEQQA